MYVIFFVAFTSNKGSTVKLGDKERLDSEQPGNSEPFPVTNMPVYIINSEQPGVSEQICDDEKVPYYQVRLYMPGQICSSKVFLFCNEFIQFIQILNFLSKLFFSPELYKEVGSYFLARVLPWISALQEWIQGKDTNLSIFWATISFHKKFRNF